MLNPNLNNGGTLLQAIAAAAVITRREWAIVYLCDIFAAGGPVEQQSGGGATASNRRATASSSAAINGSTFDICPLLPQPPATVSAKECPYVLCSIGVLMSKGDVEGTTELVLIQDFLRPSWGQALDCNRLSARPCMSLNPSAYYHSDRGLHVHSPAIAYHSEFGELQALDSTQWQAVLEALKLVNDHSQCQSTLSADPPRNVWIVKPAGKSRGRGIECLSQLGDIVLNRAGREHKVRGDSQCRGGGGSGIGTPGHADHCLVCQ